jgi:hypothetical protein
MNIDFKNFDYRLVATSQKDTESVNRIAGSPSQRIEYNFSTQEDRNGKIIHCFSRIEVSRGDRTSIYQGHSTYLLPFEQNVSRQNDVLREIDEAVFAEFLYQHLSRQTQVIFSDIDDYITIPSIRDLYLTIQQLGDAINN